MSNAGRPRKSGARYKSGKLKNPEARTRDHGTPESEMKRQQIAGPNGDPNMSSCPLDALLTRKLISQDQYNDASDYKRWYSLAIRRPIPSAGGGRVANDDADDSRIADAARKFKEAAALLLKAGRNIKDAVDNVVVYERWPHVLVSDHPRASDKYLFAGLVALSQWRRGERKAA